MKSLEEVLNIIFQEYGGLILTILSIVLSLVLIVPFMHVVLNNIFIIRKVSEAIIILKGVLE